MTGFPITRPRRVRRTEAMRGLVRETRLHPSQFVMPYFVTQGEGVQEPIGSMPGQYRWSVDRLVEEVRTLPDLGIGAILLFGIPATKDPLGSSGHDPEEALQRAVTRIKQAVPSVTVITDVCLCEYTSHGHCGEIVDGDVHNDRSLEILAKVALSHARAGADMVAPSDMMDGRVAAIRSALDREGHSNLPIMAYSAKFASAYYGPFREAAGSTPAFGDRRSYQMDPANAREALREVGQDIAEGADIVMVKPALAYLDIIRSVRDRYDLPLAAYNVSGEYAMVKAAAERGWIDERRIVLETLTALTRAGCDILITYHAKEAAGYLERA